MQTIRIIGLGPGSLEQLPLGVYRHLLAVKKVFVRTDQHPVIEQLKQEGILFHSFDHIYTQSDQFSQVYEQIVEQLLSFLEQEEVLDYAVPGHPLVAEQTVQMLLNQAKQGKFQVEIVGGQSFLDPLFTSLQVDPAEGFMLLDGTNLPEHVLQPELDLVITQVYDQAIASEVKLSLMHVFPDEYPVTIVSAAGIVGLESIQQVPLYELDRLSFLGNLTCLYVPKTEEAAVINRQYYRAREVFRTLRGPKGCPWDQKQTHHSLKKYLLEEAHEVLAAIEEEDVDHLVEELGDLLLQVFLHAQIGEDEGFFNMEDVLQSLTEKMIRRHPHVFADLQISSEEELKELWQKIKDEEKGSN